MAEAIFNNRLGDQWQAFSAGTNPAGYVHSMAKLVLSEIGIEHKGHSKLAEEFRDIPFDQIVTVCDSATEKCPVWLGEGKRTQYIFPDPAKTNNMKDFRAARNAIEKEIIELLQFHDPYRD